MFSLIVLQACSSSLSSMILRFSVQSFYIKSKKVQNRPKVDDFKSIVALPFQLFGSHRQLMKRTADDSVHAIRTTDRPNNLSMSEPKIGQFL